MDRALGRLRSYLESEGLRQHTLLWYCGDNGVPASGRLTTPFRGLKGQVYEGGIRVPGIIEWPSRIPSPRVTGMNAVTSDIFPTICDLLGIPLPDRPMDGISLSPLIDGEMSERPHPICFWDFDTSQEGRGEPYLDANLQEGTTPLVKKMDGRLTRNFRNFHHPVISDEDFSGPRAILDNRYKLVIDNNRGGLSEAELFDLLSDPAEEKDLVEEKPEIAEDLALQLRNWQESVLNSLLGADYR
jgi:arylsulfatase A-like enzyme